MAKENKMKLSTSDLCNYVLLSIVGGEAAEGINWLSYSLYGVMIILGVIIVARGIIWFVKHRKDEGKAMAWRERADKYMLPISLVGLIVCYSRNDVGAVKSWAFVAVLGLLDICLSLLLSRWKGLSN